MPELPPFSPALDGFYSAVYQELRRIAHGRLSHATPTLDTVALINEAYLRLRQTADGEWREPAHVKAVACAAMRQILLNHLRNARALKRGGERPAGLDDHDPLDHTGLTEDDVLARLDAIAALEALSPELRQIAEMRFFGYEVREVASEIGVSVPTVVRKSEKVRKLLNAYLASDP